ncbi:succinyl-diaminopimelate desuccinylase [Actinomycetaceae bacterium L2_0104]
MDLPTDVVDLAAVLVDIPSVSGNEKEIADVVEDALRACSHLEVLRDGDTVMARTNLGRASRVILAGHLDTVPTARNVPGVFTRESIAADGAPPAPCRVEEATTLWGRGSVDMKAGAAIFLALARELTSPRLDVTWVFYDHEEVEASLNGLGRVQRNHPDWLRADMAVLGEPTSGAIEGGCNGTMRLHITAHGVAAHSARPWMGVNAVHRIGEVLLRLARWEPQVHRVGGLEYRESLLAVGVEGGGARNSVPDSATAIVNFRFAPDRSPAQAEAYVRSLFAGEDLDIEVTDSAPGAAPGMDHPDFALLAGELSRRGVGEPTAKLGWTDVARFAGLAIPAINCGPGDPTLAHRVDEACPISQIRQLHETFTAWLL